MPIPPTLSQLPQIARVEILVLGNRGDRRTPVEALQSYFPIQTCVAATADQATQIADLWRQLPPAEQMRCHLPPFGLRFYTAEGMILEASLCWACNNIWAWQQGDRWGYEFDARHATALTLLATLKAAVRQ